MLVCAIIVAKASLEAPTGVRHVNHTIITKRIVSGVIVKINLQNEDQRANSTVFINKNIE